MDVDILIEDRAWAALDLEAIAMDAWTATLEDIGLEPAQFARQHPGL
jgi:hypothetical protein